MFYIFYGHDHGTDSAYIRSDTAQRTTEYLTDGSIKMFKLENI